MGSVGVIRLAMCADHDPFTPKYQRIRGMSYVTLWINMILSFFKLEICPRIHDLFLGGLWFLT